MEFIKYPSIGVYGTAIKSLIVSLRYNGKDEDGNAIYDNSRTLPVVNFKGTVKCHGTNAGVCYDIVTGDIWSQARKRILTVQNDNKGFACYVEKHKESFREIFNTIIDAYFFTDGIISIFGEYCGQGIQKGVGISKLDKMFVIFGFKYTTDTEETKWFDFYIDQYNDIRTYHIDQFGTYNINIDLNDPKSSQNELVDITNKVEEECPVAKFFGISEVKKLKDISITLDNIKELDISTMIVKEIKDVLNKLKDKDNPNPIIKIYVD